MMIVVKTIEGQMTKLQLLLSDSVDRLKVVIGERQGIEPARYATSDFWREAA